MRFGINRGFAKHFGDIFVRTGLVTAKIQNGITVAWNCLPAILIQFFDLCHILNDNTFNFLVSLLYAQAFQALYYSADQIHHGPLPRHVRFVLDEFAAMPLPGFTRELATMRSRSISASVIIQNMAQIKELYKDSWETIPGNCDTILYLGGNESSTHKYVSEMLGKATIDTKTHGQTKGKSGSYSTNFQMSGRDMPYLFVKSSVALNLS